MTRPVVITGLGAITCVGAGVDAAWTAAVSGTTGLAPITTFDPSGFACRIAGDVKDFKVTNYVPKSYRKAVKVMARDIELAVAAADLAARDAGLVTRGTLGDPPPAGAKISYDPPRVGAHIGANLIAADLNELTEALVTSRATDASTSITAGGQSASERLDMHAWGREGMTKLTPLWLLKYLPNMLACHVTIIHDTQGPSNTITCGDSSGTLSIGESLRVIQRGDADACFCGGAESKLNPMAFLRHAMTGRFNEQSNDAPAKAVRPFSRDAAGTIIGEGGGIVVLESLESFKARSAGANPAPRAYARLAGFGASQTINPRTRNATPDEQGRGFEQAIRAAIRDAGITAADIDLIVGFGIGWPASDLAEASAYRAVFGDRLASVPVVSAKPFIGNTGAASGGLDVCITAKAIAEQTIPARVNCDTPLPGINAQSAPSQPANIRYALSLSTSLGGQNAALVLARLNDK